MKIINKISLIILLFSLSSCVWENVRKPWVPHEPVSVSNLEAVYTDAIPNKITAKHWDTVDYVQVDMANEISGNLYEDGFLNMTEMFNGPSDYKPELVLKASYDQENIYILASWADKSINASYQSLFYDGPQDALKSDSATGWTSQENSDHFSLFLYKDATSADVWKWQTATSAALGLAMDMQFENGDLLSDAGENGIARNANNEGSRVMPLYEWNGESQSVQLPDGSKAILDPAYYLLASNTVEIPGDPIVGRKYFKKKCESCHGENGSGEGGENVYGPPINTVEYHRLSRQAVSDVTAAPGHDGRTYFDDLNESQQIDLIAAMRSLAGFPGHILNQPSGSAADVMAVSDVKISRIKSQNANGYTVLFIRKLETGNADDIKLETSEEGIEFDVRLSNGDDINALVSNKLKLILK